MINTQGDWLICRYCTFKVLKFKSVKDGNGRIKRVSGWNRIDNHMQDSHPDHQEALQGQIEEHMQGKESNRL